MHWFATDNLDAPHDRNVGREVITAIERAGFRSGTGLAAASQHEARRDLLDYKEQK